MSIERACSIRCAVPTGATLWHPTSTLNPPAFLFLTRHAASPKRVEKKRRLTADEPTATRIDHTRSTACGGKVCPTTNPSVVTDLQLSRPRIVRSELEAVQSTNRTILPRNWWTRRDLHPQQRAAYRQRRRTEIPAAFSCSTTHAVCPRGGVLCLAGRTPHPVAFFFRKHGSMHARGRHGVRLLSKGVSTTKRRPDRLTLIRW